MYNRLSQIAKRQNDKTTKRQNTDQKWPPSPRAPPKSKLLKDLLKNAHVRILALRQEFLHKRRKVETVPGLRGAVSPVFAPKWLCYFGIFGGLPSNQRRSPDPPSIKDRVQITCAHKTCVHKTSLNRTILGSPRIREVICSPQV